MSMAARDLLWKYPDIHRLFADLDEGTRSRLESIAVTKSFPPGSVIGHVSEVVEGAYLIVEGAVRLESLSESGDRLNFGTLSAGEVHGLVSSMDGMPSVHFATVVDGATTVLLPRAPFRDIVFGNRALCERVTAVLCERIRCMCLFNDRLAFLKPLDRVAQCLWGISTGYFSLSKNMAPLVTLEINQYELSSMLSLSRQSVNRALKSLEAEGVITISYKRIAINDLQRLRDFGQSRTV